jgi:hypothetical protein
MTVNSDALRHPYALRTPGASRRLPSRYSASNMLADIRGALASLPHKGIGVQMQIRLTLFVAILWLTGCASWQKFDGYLPTTPQASLVESVRVPGFTKRFSSVELHRVDEFVGNGSFGAKNDLFSTVTLRVDDGGLTTESIRQTWGHSAGGKVRGIADIQQLSVCGIQPLFRDLTARTLIPDVSVIGTPSMTTTYIKDVERSVLERLMVDSLSGEMASICSPKPKVTYGYQVSRQAQLRWSAAQNLRWPLAAHIRCRTADSKVLASSVVPGLEGEALEVNCVASYTSEGDYVSRYAFFEALGVYLPLETAEPERGKTVYRYTKALTGQGR